ncbi:MAG TPA: ester cyclase [Actinomycetota bacterium]|nr:ester cyclase [Actinomycetota bacterium]
MSERADRVVASILAINDRDVEATWTGDDSTTTVDVATGEVLRGPAAWYEYLREWYRGFPDGRVDIVNVIDAGQAVVVEFTGSGTHRGTYYGMTPTGRRCVDRLCNIYEFAGDRLVEIRSYWDQMSMLVQLDLLERPVRETAGATEVG